MLGFNIDKNVFQANINRSVIAGNLIMDIQKRQRTSGFSLFEMTIVLVIISVVLTGLLPFITESMQSDYANTTVERMEAIDEALRDYVSDDATDQLPCPADITLESNDGDFGRGLGTVGATTNCTSANWDATDVTGGMIPTKTLFLPDEFAFDGWGRRFAYHVSKNLTNENALDAGGESEGDIIVQDFAGTNRTDVAAYVLISHGPNGHGGYTLSGSRFDGDSENDHEQENCDCDDDAAAGTYNNAFFQHMEAFETGETARQFYFDDLVRFRMVSHLN